MAVLTSQLQLNDCIGNSFYILNSIFDLLQFVIVFPVSLLPQAVVQLSELLEEAKVGLDLPGVPHVLQRLCGGVILLEHEVGGGDGGGPAVAEVAGDEDHPASHGQSSLDELSAVGQVLGDILSWHILNNCKYFHHKLSNSNYVINVPCR